MIKDIMLKGNHMFRSLLLVFALMFSTTFAITYSAPSVAATDVGDIFTPTEGDYSIYILSKIFGDIEQSVLPGEDAATGPQLLGNVFRVFNVVALSLGVLMVIYTIVLAVLNTAHAGKMMGEKMSSMWVPVRIAFAIAMLIPKANGYCLAQVAVMWLVVQGIGAADTIWNTALDYFEAGGGLGGQQIPGTGSNSMQTGLDAIYNNNLLEGILRAVTCVAAHNKTQSTIQEPYTIYTYVSGDSHSLNFGRQLPPGNTITNSSQEGYECGRIVFDYWFASMFSLGGANSQESQDLANNANATQMSIVYQFATKISAIGVAIADGTVDMTAPFTSEFTIMKNASVSYVTDMTSNQQAFVPPSSTGPNELIEVMRGQGWITAGNYYQLLTQFYGSYYFTPNDTNTPTIDRQETSASYTAYQRQIDDAMTIYGKNPNNPNGYHNWSGKDYTTGAEQSPSQKAREDIQKAFESEAEIFEQIGFTNAVIKYAGNFMDIVSGESQSADPILNIAHYGQYLMKVSIGVMLGMAYLIPALGLVLGAIPFVALGASYMSALIFAVMPMVMSLMGLMYLQGAMLGVYLPFVPFIIFAIGALGWIMAVIESMVAAPLVALGMTLPEGHEIYGRAEPAYMMLINLFLRPSLMILGFVSALLVTWLAVDLINLSFYTALRYGGIAPDPIAGPFVIILLYMGVLVALVTKVFNLINVVPDKVLRWIGDNTQAVGDAGEVLSGAKQGSQEGAQATGQMGKQGGDMGQKASGPILGAGHQVSSTSSEEPEKKEEQAKTIQSNTRPNGP